jgi:membrane-anchored protein YejM (alkaline phosphatase superfamily)
MLKILKETCIEIFSIFNISFNAMRENNLSFSLKGPKTDTAKIYIYITKYIQEIKFQTLLPFRFSLTLYFIAPSVFSNVLLDCLFGFL